MPSFVCCSFQQTSSILVRKTPVRPTAIPPDSSIHVHARGQEGNRCQTPPLETHLYVDLLDLDLLDFDFLDFDLQTSLTFCPSKRHHIRPAGSSTLCESDFLVRHFSIQPASSRSNEWMSWAAQLENVELELMDTCMPQKRSCPLQVQSPTCPKVFWKNTTGI